MSEANQLWVIVDDIPDRRRRYRIRDRLRFAGTVIRPGVVEIVTTPTRMERLLRDISGLLGPDDNLRIYRICENCRQVTTIFGPGELSKPPVAIIV